MVALEQHCLQNPELGVNTQMIFYLGKEGLKNRWLFRSLQWGQVEQGAEVTVLSSPISLQFQQGLLAAASNCFGFSKAL